MSVRPASRPPAPFTVPSGGDLDQRLAAIATELNRKAKCRPGRSRFRVRGAHRAGWLDLSFNGR